MNPFDGWQYQLLNLPNLVPSISYGLGSWSGAAASVGVPLASSGLIIGAGISKYSDLFRKMRDIRDAHRLVDAMDAEIEKNYERMLENCKKNCP